mmetsp:Transcript_92742/g.198820  ORF Transcript_92742/g.198820 Transcript_92742/m.198820 type:complete len:233 (+) Transcript_92742:627-1325(+)
MFLHAEILAKGYFVRDARGLNSNLTYIAVESGRDAKGDAYPRRLGAHGARGHGHPGSHLADLAHGVDAAALLLADVDPGCGLYLGGSLASIELHEEGRVAPLVSENIIHQGGQLQPRHDGLQYRLERGGVVLRNLHREVESLRHLPLAFDKFAGILTNGMAMAQLDLLIIIIFLHLAAVPGQERGQGGGAILATPQLQGPDGLLADLQDHGFLESDGCDVAVPSMTHPLDLV